jgi:hypothetical protein
MDMDRGEASAGNTFWAAHGQPWRTEPEIAPERQAQLAARRAITPDVVRGAFPFTGMRLERADIEWLLATHEDRRGPIDPPRASASSRTRSAPTSSWPWPCKPRG